MIKLAMLEALPFLLIQLFKGYVGAGVIARANA
jgi:hypothetical protein